MIPDLLLDSTIPSLPNPLLSFPTPTFPLFPTTRFPKFNNSNFPGRQPARPGRGVPSASAGAAALEQRPQPLWLRQGGRASIGDSGAAVPRPHPRWLRSAKTGVFYIHIHTYTYVYIHIHTYTCTYIHIHTHIYIHTYTYLT